MSHTALDTVREARANAQQLAKAEQERRAAARANPTSLYALLQAASEAAAVQRAPVLARCNEVLCAHLRSVLLADAKLGKVQCELGADFPWLPHAYLEGLPAHERVWCEDATPELAYAFFKEEALDVDQTDDGTIVISWK